MTDALTDFTLRFVVGSAAALFVTGCPATVGQLYPAPPSELTNCDPPELVSLPVDPIVQQSDTWCWAASAQMVMRFLGHEVSQCDQASKAMGASCFCPPCSPSNASGERRTHPPCDSIGAFPAFEQWQFDAYRGTTVLSLAAIKAEIACRRSPVAYSYVMSSTRYGEAPDGHMELVVGYDGDLLEVIDPSPQCPGTTHSQLVEYSQYLNGNRQDHEHWEDRLGVKWAGN